MREEERAVVLKREIWKSRDYVDCAAGACPLQPNIQPVPLVLTDREPTSLSLQTTYVQIEPTAN